MQELVLGLRKVDRTGGGGERGGVGVVIIQCTVLHAFLFYLQNVSDFLVQISHRPLYHSALNLPSAALSLTLNSTRVSTRSSS